MIVYQNYAKELISKIGRLSELTRHAPSVGTFHESIVRNYLDNFISKRFSVKTGFVYNPDIKESSPQIDILIIDENVPSAYLFQDNDLVVVIPDSVVCAIEIKTNFDKKSFEDISKKSANYRKVNPKGFNIIALCFKSKVKDIETISSWYKDSKIEDNLFLYPGEITVLDSFIFKLAPEQMMKPFGMSYFIFNNEAKIEKEEAILTNFLFSIMKLCELKANEHSMRTVNAIFDGDVEKLFKHVYCAFKYGKGVLPVDEIKGVKMKSKGSGTSF